MPPVSFSVSEVRVAASCPRILYFDAEQTRRENLKPRAMTRIWKAGGDDSTACGSLFHHPSSGSTARRTTAPEVRAVLEGPADLAAIEQRAADLPQPALHRPRRPGHEGRPRSGRRSSTPSRSTWGSWPTSWPTPARGKPAGEILDQMFGDRRRRVDVTFQVGPAGEPVHVTGILDYVFYDWRTENHRIIDYKLTPARTSRPTTCSRSASMP